MLPTRSEGEHNIFGQDTIGVSVDLMLSCLPHISGTSEQKVCKFLLCDLFSRVCASILTFSVTLVLQQWESYIKGM